jgi:hypothetical protein
MRQRVELAVFWRGASESQSICLDSATHEKPTLEPLHASEAAQHPWPHYLIDR